MPDLAPQQRVVQEKTDLDTKLTDLNKFIDFSADFKGLPESERMRLRAQSAIMQQYSAILAARIAAF
jgi:predicted RecB family endonuclease